MADQATDLSLANARLEKAIAALENRVKSLGSKGKAVDGDLFKTGAANEREKALEQAAREASAALGRAAAEMRAALDAATAGAEG